MHGTETPKQIVMNLCTGVGIHDVITSTNFYDHHLQGLGVVGGQICIVALTTLSTVRVCDNNNNEYIWVKMYRRWLQQTDKPLALSDDDVSYFGR